MKRFSIVALLLFAFAVSLSAQDFAKFLRYRDRYKVNCVNEKIVDNHGDGYDSLYGVRNMRTILFGVAYRGGANNAYNKIDKRDNHNPLPLMGLENLAEQGFSKAIYLYGTNFKDSKKTIVKGSDTLQYIQNSGNERKQMKEIMLAIKDVIMNPAKGPIYLHCWNGWHQSGYVSSAILRQFCGYTSEQAYQYWLDNTDGVNKGYEHVKGQVKEFVPFNDITIDEKTKSAICPCQKSTTH